MDINVIINLFLESYPRLFQGLGITLFLTLVSIVFGTVLGVLLSLGKIYGTGYLSRIITMFIGLIRGTPLMVQLFILYYGFPSTGLRLAPLTAAVIGFTINSAAYQAEYLRGSIESINTNQLKAALSIGMTKWQGIGHVILPQAFRRVIPSWTNEFIYLLKYTSLAYIIGATEIMTAAKIIASRNYRFFEIYLIVAVIYLVIVLLFTKLFSIVEEKFRIPGFEYYRE
ncbi:MAG TPA: amino acid ABC transporter permease [Halanaerobiales bacterium]|nr:amino acid ABC transporter permease [Halanaerobiales bacterium]